MKKKDKIQQKGQATAAKKSKNDIAREFDEFKQRISEFQNKNEQIINRIRNTYTVKKRNLQFNINRNQLNTQSNIVYYQEHQEDLDNIHEDIQRKKRIQNNTQKVITNKYANYNSPPNELAYLPEANQVQKTRSHHYQQEKNMYTYPDQEEIDYNEYQKSMNKMNRPKVQNLQLEKQNNSKISINRNTQSRTTHRFAELEQNVQQLQLKLKEVTERNTVLEEELEKRSEEANKVKNIELRFKNNTNYLKRTIEDAIQNYQQEVVYLRFSQVEKYLKKQDNRLRNLSLKLRDALQGVRSKKIINKSKQRRRESVNKNKSSSTSEVDAREQRENSYKEESFPLSMPKFKAKNSVQTVVKNKNFEDIAANYEKMIQEKTIENEKLQFQLKAQYKERQSLSQELKRVKLSLEEKQKESSTLKNVKKNNKQQSKQLFEKQYNQLKQKIFQLEQTIQIKTKKQKQQAEIIHKLEKNKKQQLEEHKESYSQNLNKKNSLIAELQKKLKEEGQSYQSQLNELRNRLMDSDRKIMEKDCDLLGVTNKLKKLQKDAILKDQKLKELQSILMNQNDNADLLERSMSIDVSHLSTNEYKYLHDAVKRLQEDIEQKNMQLQALQRKMMNSQIQRKKIQNQLSNLTSTNAYLQKQLREQSENKDISNEKQINKMIQQKDEILEELQRQKQLVEEQKTQLETKNNQLLNELKKVKEENLIKHRDIIKLTSQLTFNKGELQNIENKISKLKQDYEKVKNSKLQSEDALKQDISRLLGQKTLHEAQIQSMKFHILQLQAERNNNDKEEDILGSLNASEVSFNFLNKKQNDQEIMLLKEKIRELTVEMETKKTMESEIKSDYKNNIEKIRLEIVEQNKLIQKLQSENEELNKALKKKDEELRNDISFENYKTNLYEQKLVQLENQCNTLKESQFRLNELLHELVQNMKSKQEERQKLLKTIQQHEISIEQLKTIIDMKDKNDNIRVTNLSHQPNKEQSLRFSVDHSEQLLDSAELSYLSNISDVFKKDDILHDRMKKGKTSREDYIKLFTKTSAYIKSLKKTIESKEKRIKVLEKQIMSMKKQDKSWKDKESNDKRINTLEDQLNDSSDEDCDEYKDYESVQLDTRRSKHFDLVKQIQKQKELVNEENKILINQIQALQDQISRAQQQQNSLVRIKDLYKQQIKKLMQKNEIHNKQFQMQIKQMRDELQQSDSYHNWQALKQLFIKIVTGVHHLDEITNKMKREDKKREIDEYVNVMCSIFRIDVPYRKR